MLTPKQHLSALPHYHFWHLAEVCVVVCGDAGVIVPEESLCDIEAVACGYLSPVQLAEFMGTLLGCPANLVLHPLIERGYVPQNV